MRCVAVVDLDVLGVSTGSQALCESDMIGGVDRQSG